MKRTPETGLMCKLPTISKTRRLSGILFAMFITGQVVAYLPWILSAADAQSDTSESLQIEEHSTNQSPKPLTKTGTLVYRDCGWTWCMRYPDPAVMQPVDIERATVGPLAGSKVSIYQFCLFGRDGLQVSTPLLPRAKPDPNKINSPFAWRAHQTFSQLSELKTDPLKVISAACRKHSIACQVSIPISGENAIYKQSPWFAFRPSGLLPDGNLNYADKAALEFRKAQVREILSRYDIDGIDLDFSDFQTTFAQSSSKQENLKAIASNLIGLVRDLRKITRDANKTLSARFDYDPDRCLASGLNVDKMLAEGLFDQISLGAAGDRTPDARIDWWILRTRPTGCKVFPSIETLPHPVPNPVYGGIGTHPSGDMVKRGYGRPSPAYMRAVAANAYAAGADGLMLFNTALADGPFPKCLLNELAEPRQIAMRDKQYVAGVWGLRPRIYFDFWTSRLSMTPQQDTATYPIHIADDFAAAARAGKTPKAMLTLDLRGINRASDVEVLVNETPVRWNGYEYNHYDHGFWDDILEFDVPISALRKGPNIIRLNRKRTNKLFEGSLEARKCVLEIIYPGSKRDPAETEVRRRLNSDNWFAPGKIERGLAATNPAKSDDHPLQPKKLPKIIVYNDDGWSSY
ncbi:MAG: hypothetical protein JXM70_27290, partial [Pirellulales bacterium]|nr:hypothetical protein [Pirellulales bacterium]